MGHGRLGRLVVGCARRVATGRRTCPRDAAAAQEMRDIRRVVRLTWNSAYAGVDPIASYQIWRGTQNIGNVAHSPQTTRTPFQFEDTLNDRAAHRYRIVAVDSGGQEMTSGDLLVGALG